MDFKIETTVKYYFGRLNLIYSRNNVTKYEFLWNSLFSGKSYEKGNFKWGFFEVTKEKIEGKEFFCGYLVKYELQGKEAIVDEDRKKLEETNVEMKRKGQCLFALNPETGIIVHSIYGSIISFNQFNTLFCELIKEANDRIFIEAEITSINDDFSIEKIISEFDMITRLSFVLHPSNPSNRDIWKATDEKINRIGADRYTEEYSVNLNSNKGLKIEKSSEAYGNILMAIDGYGIANFTGKKNGKTKVKSTKSQSIIVHAPKDNIPAMLNGIINEYIIITKRFEK